MRYPDNYRALTTIAAIPLLWMTLVLPTAAYDGVAQNPVVDAQPWANPPPPPGPYGRSYDPWGRPVRPLPAPASTLTTGNIWRQPRTDLQFLIPPPGPAPADRADRYPAPEISNPNPLFRGDMPATFPGELPPTFPGEDRAHSDPRQAGGNPWQRGTRSEPVTTPNRWAMPRRVPARTTDRWAEPRSSAAPQRDQTWAIQEMPAQWPPLEPVPGFDTYQLPPRTAIPYRPEITPRAPQFLPGEWSQPVPASGLEWPPLEFNEPFVHRPQNRYGPSGPLIPPPPMRNTATPTPDGPPPKSNREPPARF